MANITFDNSLFTFKTGGTVSFPYTVGANPNTMLLMATYQKQTVTTFPISLEYGGTLMTEVVSNSGPAVNFGELGIYKLKNPLPGTNNITFSTGFDATLIYCSIFSYYNVGNINNFTNPAAQGSYAASFVSDSLSTITGNSLLWAVAAGADNSGRNLTINFSSGAQNVGSTGADVEEISAGDFGIFSTPTSGSVSIGNNPGSGQACVGLLALSPVPEPQGAFLLGMI